MKKGIYDGNTICRKEGREKGREGGKKEKQTRNAPTARFPRFLKSLEGGRADDMSCAPSRVDLFLRLPQYCRGLDLKIVILRVLEQRKGMIHSSRHT